MRGKVSRGMGRAALAAAAALVAAGTVAAPGALAAFPYTHAGGNPADFDDLHLGPGETPSDLSGDGNAKKFAATPDPGNSFINSSSVELDGVRGARVADTSASAQTAWMTTVGRPDVGIAVLDSGIKWNDEGAMSDLRRKVLLNRGELPAPNHARSNPLVAGQDCSQLGNS